MLSCLITLIRIWVINKIDLCNFHRWVYVLCESCSRYVCRARHPVTRGWIADQHQQGYTIVICDDMTVADRPITGCVCPKRVEQKELL